MIVDWDKPVEVALKTNKDGFYLWVGVEAIFPMDASGVWAIVTWQDANASDRQSRLFKNTDPGVRNKPGTRQPVQVWIGIIEREEDGSIYCTDCYPSEVALHNASIMPGDKILERKLIYQRKA